MNKQLENKLGHAKREITALNKKLKTLQEEHKSLTSYVQNGIESFANSCLVHSEIDTPPFSEFQEQYGNLCLMCVVDERNTLQEECNLLRSAILRLCNIYVVDDYYCGHQRDEQLNVAMNQAINAAMAYHTVDSELPEQFTLLNKTT